MADSSTAHPKALPGWEKAHIKDEKVAEYALNPSHTYGQSRGADKARVFKSALGFDQSNWPLLKQAVLDGLPNCEAVFRLEDEHGKRYRVTMWITGPNGRTAPVLTAWIIPPRPDHGLRPEGGQVREMSTKTMDYLAREGDVVELTADLPAEGLVAGSRGVVVEAYTEPSEAYDVAFEDENGECLGLADSLRPAQIRNVSRPILERE